MTCLARHEITVPLMGACSIFQRAMAAHSIPGYGPDGSGNRPVRTRTLGGEGAGGIKPPGYPIRHGISPYFCNCPAYIRPR